MEAYSGGKQIYIPHPKQGALENRYNVNMQRRGQNT